MMHSVRTAGLVNEGEQNNFTEYIVLFWRVCAGPWFYLHPKIQRRIIVFHLSVPRIHSRKEGYRFFSL